MRNLAEYPITDNEIIECLKKLSEQMCAEGRVGDMRPMLLTEAAKRLDIALNAPCSPWDEMIDKLGRLK